MPEDKFYPSLSSIAKIPDLPQQLGFIQEGLEYIFDKLYFTDLQYLFVIVQDISSVNCLKRNIRIIL